MIDFKEKKNCGSVITFIIIIMKVDYSTLENFTSAMKHCLPPGLGLPLLIRLTGVSSATSEVIKVGGHHV